MLRKVDGRATGVSEMRIWRKMTRVTCLDRLRNRKNTLFKKTKRINDYVKNAHKRKMNWILHENRLPHDERNGTEDVGKWEIRILTLHTIKLEDTTLPRVFGGIEYENICRTNNDDSITVKLPYLISPVQIFCTRICCVTWLHEYYTYLDHRYKILKAMLNNTTIGLMIKSVTHGGKQNGAARSPVTNISIVNRRLRDNKTNQNKCAGI